MSTMPALKPSSPYARPATASGSSRSTGLRSSLRTSSRTTAPRSRREGRARLHRRLGPHAARWYPDEANPVASDRSTRPWTTRFWSYGCAKILGMLLVGLAELATRPVFALSDAELPTALDAVAAGVAMLDALRL